jgi:peptidoglycan/xylan/chitin deacetylase (PgdA/CDA1 family)
MFHGFTDGTHEGLENCQGKHLHVGRFEQFLNHLKTNFNVISLVELTSCLRRKVLPPPLSVVLTFDDGFLSNYTLAFPLLQKYGLPATIFVATEFVDEKKPIWVDRIDYALNKVGRSKEHLIQVKRQFKSLTHDDLHEAVRRFEEEVGHRLETSNGPNLPAIYHALDWDHIRTMQQSGLITIGAHTHTHPILGHCSADVAFTEVMTSKSIIERETGRPCTTFCYPNGGPGDFTEATEEILRGLEFETTVTTIGGRNSSHCSPFLLKRLGVTNDMDIAQFELLMAGLNFNQR